MKFCKEDILDTYLQVYREFSSVSTVKSKDMADFLILQGELEPLTLNQWVMWGLTYLDIKSLFSGFYYLTF